jgi:hypothetical protein
VSKLSGHCPLLTFEVSGKTVVTAASTVFHGGACGELRNKQTVAVTGVTQADQTVLASTIQIKDNENE